jgi:hypothetical protein
MRRLSTCFLAAGCCWLLRAAPAGAQETNSLYPIIQRAHFHLINSKGTNVLTLKGIFLPRFGWDHHFAEGLEPAVEEIRRPGDALPGPGTTGYIDRQGNWAIKPQFQEASPFSEGLAMVKPAPWTNKYGYIDRTGRMVIPAKFDKADDFSEGLALVVSNGLSEYINRSGEPVIKPQSDSWLFESHHFSEGVASVAVNERWGFIDKQGKMVIPPQFDSAGDFSEGLAWVCTNELFGYVNHSGAFVIPPRLHSAMDFSEGLAAVEVEPFRMAYIDTQGRVVFRVPGGQMSSAKGSFSEGLANVYVMSGDKGLWGYVDKTGRMVIKPQFDEAGSSAAWPESGSTPGSRISTGRVTSCGARRDPALWRICWVCLLTPTWICLLAPLSGSRGSKSDETLAHPARYGLARRCGDCGDDCIALAGAGVPGQVAHCLAEDLSGPRLLSRK